MGGVTGKAGQAAGFFSDCWQEGAFFRFFFASFSVFFLFLFLLRFNPFLDRFGRSFWEVFGTKFGSRRLLKRYCLKKVNVHEKLYKQMKKQDFRVQEATQNDPRSPQDGLKTVFFGFFFHFVFCIDFWSLFDAILVPFWRGLGSPNRDF